MTKFVCLHCRATMVARKRPKACGNCGKVSHERDICPKCHKIMRPGGCHCPVVIPNAYLGDGPKTGTALALVPGMTPTRAEVARG